MWNRFDAAMRETTIDFDTIQIGLLGVVLQPGDFLLLSLDNVFGFVLHGVDCTRMIVPGVHVSCACFG